MTTNPSANTVWKPEGPRSTAFCISVFLGMPSDLRNYLRRHNRLPAPVQTKLDQSPILPEPQTTVEVDHSLLVPPPAGPSHIDLALNQISSSQRAVLPGLSYAPVTISNMNVSQTNFPLASSGSYIEYAHFPAE